MIKINIKENIKNWLLTLGIASCFGLAALGVNAAQTYKQTSAYDYQDNGTLSFSIMDTDNDLLFGTNLNILFDFGYQFNDITHDVGTDFYIVDTDDVSHLYNYFACSIDTTTYSINFYDVSDNYVQYSRVNGDWSFSDSDGVSYDVVSAYFLPSSQHYYDLLNYCLTLNVPIISTYQINVSSIATFNAIYNYVHVQDDSEIILSSYIVDGNNTYNFNSLVASSSGSDTVLDFNNDSGNHVSYLLSSNTVTVSSSDIIGQSGPFTLTLTSELSNTNYRALIYAIESYNSPQSTGNFLTALTDFTSLIVGGITNLAEGIATGVVSMATSLFIDNSALSIYGAMVAIFAGLALAVGITTKVYTWVTTLGN